MAKEFGVVLGMKMKSSSEIVRCSTDWEELVNYRCGNIYVAKESEEIFEPHDYDLAGFTRDDGISTVGQYDKNKDAFINGNFRILKKYNPKIIMRDNKQFFMPEVEND